LKANSLNAVSLSQGSSYDLKTGPGDMWSGGYPQPPPGYYPYESSFGPQYPYDRYSRACI